MRRIPHFHASPLRRALHFEGLEQRLPLATDFDDSLNEARSLGTISTVAKAADARVDVDTDVDLYRFTAAAGQTVDFDIDTPFNGPGGLDSFVRLFDANGQQLALNNNAASAGETRVGFDAFLRHTFATGGTFYLGVSNSFNTSYDSVTGERDTTGGVNTIGDYRLVVQGLPADNDDTLVEASSLGAIGTTPAIATARVDPDVDVDLYRFTVRADQSVDFDIDTPFNGPGGLGSFVRLFDANGQQLAFNNNGVAPGETQFGFDAYLRHTFAIAGTYFIGVSNWINTAYDPITGNGDLGGGQHSIGDYQLVVNTAPDDALNSTSAAIAAAFPEVRPVDSPMQNMPAFAAPDDQATVGVPFTPVSPIAEDRFASPVAPRASFLSPKPASALDAFFAELGATFDATQGRQFSRFFGSD